MGHLAHAVSVFEYLLYYHTTYIALDYSTLSYCSLSSPPLPPYLILSYATQCCTVLYYERRPLHYIFSHLSKYLGPVRSLKIFAEWNKGISLPVQYTFFHTHMHTRTHTCTHVHIQAYTHSYYLTLLQACQVSSCEHWNRAEPSTCFSCRLGGMLWDGCQWPEQPSLKSLEALPLLPQESHQCLQAGFCSVSTRHGLWAWNEWWGNDMKQLTDGALTLLPGWPQQSVLQNPPSDGHSASGRGDEWGWSEWHTNDMD